jgi:hypothetical protein
MSEIDEWIAAARDLGGDGMVRLRDLLPEHWLGATGGA